MFSFVRNCQTVFQSRSQSGCETVHLRLGLEPTCQDSNLSKTLIGTWTHVARSRTWTKPTVFQMRSHTWFQDLTKLRFFFFFLNKCIYFSYLFLAAFGLRCWSWAFSSCGEQGLLCCSAHAPHCSGFSCCRVWALGAQASVVVARGLSSCDSHALEHRLSSCGTQA